MLLLLDLRQTRLRESEDQRNRVDLGDDDEAVRGGRTDDVAHIDLTNSDHAIDRRHQAREAELHIRGVNQRLIGLDSRLQLPHLRLLGLDQLWRGPAFVSQCGVASEIGLGIDELGLIAFQVSSVLVDQGLIGTWIDLREQVAGMHGLAFGEVDAHDLPLDLGAHDVGVVRNHRADTAKIDRHVMLGDRSSHDGRGCGWSRRGSNLVQWMDMREVQQTAGGECGNQQDSRDSDVLFHDRSRLEKRNVSAATGVIDVAMVPAVPKVRTPLFNHEPGPVGANVDPLGLLPGVIPTALVVVEETVDGDEIVGIVGITGAAPAVGNMPIVGTAAAELTPRLPISVDPIGIPARAPPPGVVGDVDIGVEDEAMLLEPEPHIPDMPEVSSIPEVVDIPDVADIPDDVGIPGEVDIPDVAAVAGAADPTPIPPPSKLAVDPNIDDGEVPEVEHVEPLPGIAIVPVRPVGAGLMPGDAISVEPRGMPVWETAEPAPMPSGEVAPMVGVGLTIPLTCAMATLQAKSAGTAAAINENLTGVLRLPAASSQRAPISIIFVTIRLVRGYQTSVNLSVVAPEASE